jgi:hypothetical protein
MATDIRHETEPSLTSLVSGIIGDAQQLMRQELALARREVAEEFQKAKQAAIALSAGIAVLALGGLFLAFTIVHLLAWGTPIPLWGCYAIVGGVLVILGVALFFIGKNTADRIHRVPRQTVETMKENVQWLKNQT